MVGDGVSANDVAVRTVCKILDPQRKRLDPKQVRVLCIDHSMHRAAYHFIKALGAPSFRTAKRKHRTTTHESIDDEDDDGWSHWSDREDVDDDDEDINTSMDVDASSNDVDAMLATTTVDYDPGDTLGKVMAFVNQVRMSSEGVREYLHHACNLRGVKPIELRLWVRTRWGSLSNCLESVLVVQKVSQWLIIHLM
jgi:hypothetical protein